MFAAPLEICRTFFPSPMHKCRSTVRLALLLNLAHEVTEAIKAAREVHEEVMLPFGIFPFEKKEAITRRFFNPRFP